jgi:hypothetical protein
MLCKICLRMLRGGAGKQWLEYLRFAHHSSTVTLRHSRDAGCSICRALATDLKKDINLAIDQDIVIEALLSELKELPGKRNSAYRLDFLLETKRIHTFVLQETSNCYPIRISLVAFVFRVPD